jgi:uncharacterized protein
MPERVWGFKSPLAQFFTEEAKEAPVEETGASSLYNSPMDDRPRFLADSMLGKLARWLILLGYDAAYAQDGRSDIELLEQAHREGRVFLTRDAKIPDVTGLSKIVLREQRFEAQLERLIRTVGLVYDPARLFSRCTYCNEPLAPLTREEALPLVPPLVRELATPFFRCPGCRRVYWNGTHTERAVKKLERLFQAPKRKY